MLPDIQHERARPTPAGHGGVGPAPQELGRTNRRRGRRDGAPGDAGGTEPFWPHFEAGGMKRVIIGNSTRVESFVSEACDLWKEVDTAKLQGLVMGFLMNSNSSTPPS